MNAFEEYNELRPGQEFKIPSADLVFVKLDFDPFGAPIGQHGWCCVDNGTTGHIGELILGSMPLGQQIEIVD